MTDIDENQPGERPAPEAAPQTPVAEALSPAREGPFGPIAPGARLTYGWASPIAAIGLYLLSAVPASLVLIVVVAVYVTTSGGDPTAISPDNLPADLELLIIVVFSVVQFPVWAGLVIWWVRGFERRSLASAGLRAPNWLRKYARGLLIGAAAVVALMIFTPFVEPAEVVEIDDPNLGRLLTPVWLAVMAAAVVFFLVQSTCEEIAFRGWMMSAVAARWGLALGVIANTVVFGLLHVHVFASGAAAGTASILAITFVGLFMSLWAVYDRSVAGVCGAHGAFNSMAVILGLIGGAAQAPDAGPGEVLLRTIEQATATDGEAGVGSALVQLLVFAVFSAFAVWLLRRRAKPAS